jgi:hypothetical protein
MPVHYRYSGDKEAGIAIKRTVDRELDKHLDNTRLGNLEQNRSVTTFANGTTIECKSIFNNHLVNVFVPVGGVKKEELTKNFKEIKELIFFVWLGEPDPSGSIMSGPNPVCINLWNTSLDAAIEIITPKEISNFFLDTNSVYENDTVGCLPEDGGKYFYPQLRWYFNQDKQLEELINISDTIYDGEIYTDAWYISTNAVTTFISDYIWNQDPDDFPSSGWEYKNTDNDFNPSISWGFDDEDGGYALLYPASSIYTLESIYEYTTDYIIDILRYNTTIEDNEIKSHIVSGENIYNYKNNSSYDWFRETIATGFYFFGMKSAYAEVHNKYQTYVSYGDMTEVQGSCVCKQYKKYTEASCYIYLFQKYVATTSITNQHTEQYIASDSSGDTKTTTIDNPLVYTVGTEVDFWIRVNDPYDGYREYYVDTLEGTLGLTSSIYDYGGYPLYTYIIKDPLREKIWFGYIHRNKHVVSEKFNMTDKLMCDFYGSAEDNLYAGKVYWEHLHAAILTRRFYD